MSTSMRLLRILPLFLCALGGRAQTTQGIFSDSLINGWQNYSWATVTLSNLLPVHTGSTSVAVTAKGFEAVYFHRDVFETAAYQAVRFWLNGGAGGQQLQVNALRLGQPQSSVMLPVLAANTWTMFTIPLSDLGVGNVADCDGFWIQNATGATLAGFYVDDMDLTLAPVPSLVQMTVQAQTVLRTVDPRFYGVNLAMWDSLLLAPQTGPLLAAIKEGVLRIPGGSASDDYDWQTNKQVTGAARIWANGPGNFAKVGEAQGAQVYVTVNYGSGTPEQAAAWVAYYNGQSSNPAALGTDSKSHDWKTVGYWAALRGAAPLAIDDGFNHLRISHPAPFGFKYWEVGNECYGTWEVDLHGVAASGLTGEKYDPYTYAQAFKEFRSRMLAVDPTVRVGAVAVSLEDEWGIKTHPATNPNNGAQHTGWTPVMLATMKSLGIAPDFLIFHYYAQNSGNESDLALLQKGSEITRNAQNLRMRLNDYLGAGPAANVELAMTELNSVSSNPGKQTSNLVNGLFYADAYATAAKTEFNTVVWWDLHNGAETNHNNASYLYGWRAFGCYDLIAGTNFPSVAAHTGLPTYQAANLLTYWARGGDQVLAATSNYSWLSVHAAKLASGRLALLVINKHPDSDLSAQISLSGFAPGGGPATVHLYGKINDAQNSASPGLSASTIASVSSSFNYTFPSYSMTIIELPAGASTPAILTPPVNQAVQAGGTATFSVTASGAAPLTYQWYKDGVALAGATGSTLTLSNLQSAQVGTYTVTVSNSSGSSTSSGATLILGNPGRLINLSVRSQAGSGSQTLIVGFVISGSGNKPVLVRGTGPTLTNFGLSGVLADPKLDLYQGSTVIGTNDSWGAAPNLPAIIATTRDKLGEFALNAKDTILLQPLVANLYTAQVTGVGNATGVALIEVFDTDNTPPTAPEFASQPRLINLSARTYVGTGEGILIAGFVINGDVPKRLMIRATGPTLAKFGVAGVIADPQLQVFSGGTLVAENDSWGTSPHLSEIVAAGGDKLDVFPLDPKEAVLIVTLPPGPYTAQVRGANATVGISLVEINELP